MTDDLQRRLDEALKNPQNMGEMAGADSIGTVGNAECGDMLRVWVKFKDENGRKFKYRCTSDDRSIDHVLPISRGGSRNTFENSVCSCKECNINIKKNRLPEEVVLELIRKPFVPKRNKDEFVSMKFSYKKSKLSHIVYLQKFLGMKSA